MVKSTDLKCKSCGKSIGKLNTSGKPIFETIHEGVIEYNGFYCSEDCYQRINFDKWLNEWGDFQSNKLCRNGLSLTDYGKGYMEALRDVSKRYSSKHRIKKVEGKK